MIFSSVYIDVENEVIYKVKICKGKGWKEWMMEGVENGEWRIFIHVERIVGGARGNLTRVQKGDHFIEF